MPRYRLSLGLKHTSLKAGLESLFSMQADSYNSFLVKKIYIKSLNAVRGQARGRLGRNSLLTRSYFSLFRDEGEV